MPNIRILDTPDIGLQPSQTGVTARDQAARRTGGFYNQVADAYNTVAGLTQDTGNRIASTVRDAGDVAVKYMDHREISHGAAAGAELSSKLSDLWNKTAKNADPNDPAVAAKFREETLEPELEKFKGGFSTERSQQWAESFVDSYRKHMFEKTAADMSTLAGISVRQNVETLKNQLSNLAINDPTSIKSSLDLAEHSVGAMVDSSPNMKGVDAARVRAEVLGDVQSSIVKAAAIGAINANPEAGLKQFSSPEYSKYISGAELKQLEVQANTVKRAARIEENYALQTQKMQKQDASDSREGEYLVKMHSDDLKERASVSAKAIAGDFTLTREARERMISMVDRSTKPETDAKISRATTVELFNRMRTDDNADPVKMKNWIDDAYSAGNLTWGDRSNLIKEVEDRKTPAGLALAQDRAQFFKQYAGAIAGRAYDPVIGSPKLYTAERDARRIEQDLKQKGLDPHLAYDPTSEYFIGKKVPKWAGSMQGDLSEKAAPSRNDVMPAVPPADQRPVGLYETPKGKMRWTGTGWVQP